MARCKRCGQCCHLDVNDKKGEVPCPYLIKIKSGKDKGKTVCKIYRNRLGKHLGHDNYCGWREDDDFEYPGCPHNKKKATRPAKRKTQRIKNK